MKTTKNKTKCVSCKKRIPDQEPDLMLERVDTAERVFLHTGCAGGAFAMVALEPDVWILNIRHVEPSSN